MNEHLTIVGHDLKFPKVSLTEPSRSFYLHIAAEIDRSPFPFFLATSRRKKIVIAEAKKWCKKVSAEDGVVSADVFNAILIPPGTGKLLKERPGTPLARYDFAILIEVSTQQKLSEILQGEAYKRLRANLEKITERVHIITATNVKRIASVDHNKQGVFLFNYFYADDRIQNLEVWEYTAGWFQKETGLDNSTVLLPINEKTSQYKIINHCRWDSIWDILPSLLFKKSFHSYVLDNFYANKVAAMPVLYKLA